MDNSILIIVLAIATLVIVVAFATWQLKKVRTSQTSRGEHPGGVAGPD